MAGSPPKILMEWAGTGRTQHWSCTVRPKGAPKPWDDPQQGMGRAFPFPVPPVGAVGAKSLILLGSAAAPGPLCPLPTQPLAPQGVQVAQGPPGAASTGGVALAVAAAPWDVVPRGRAVGKVWVLGCQGWVPPRLGVWDTPLPSSSPPSSPLPAALGALVLCPPCPTAGHCPWMCLCPNSQHPDGLAGNRARTVQGLLAFICSIRWHQEGHNK